MGYFVPTWIEFLGDYLSGLATTFTLADPAAKIDAELDHKRTYYVSISFEEMSTFWPTSVLLIMGKF